MKGSGRMVMLTVCSSLVVGWLQGGCASQAAPAETQPVAAAEPLPAPPTQQSSQELEQLVAPHRIVPGPVSCADSGRCDPSYGNRGSGSVAATKPGSERRGTCDRSRRAILGSQRQGSYPVSWVAWHDGQEFILDVLPRRGVRERATECPRRRSGDASASATDRKLEELRAGIRQHRR